jgi:hypothetical protein
MDYRGQAVRIEVRPVPGGYNWVYELGGAVYTSPGRPLPDEAAIRVEAEQSARRRIDRLIDSGALREYS